MPHLVIWSPQAVEDIGKAYIFLASKNLAAAQAAAEAIYQQADILASFPHAGRPAQDLEAEHRELLIHFGSSGYVLLYQVDTESQTIAVLAVRHQKEVGY